MRGKPARRAPRPGANSCSDVVPIVESGATRDRQRGMRPGEGEPGEGEAMRATRRSAVPAVLILLGVSIVPLGRAAAGELVLVPGLTPAQRSMAAAIDVVCPKLLAAGFATQDSATGDLTRRCREMRQTANALQGVGVTTFSLGLTNDQLANTLGLLTPEQAAAQGGSAFNVEVSPFRAIAGRLSALRLR